MEFVNFTKASQLLFVSKLRPIFIGLAIATGVILLPLSIVLGITLSPLVYAIYNGGNTEKIELILVTAFLLLLLIFLTTYGGFRFLNFLRNFYNATQNVGYGALLKKVNSVNLFKYSDDLQCFWTEHFCFWSYYYSDSVQFSVFESLGILVIASTIETRRVWNRYASSKKC